ALRLSIPAGDGSHRQWLARHAGRAQEARQETDCAHRRGGRSGKSWPAGRSNVTGRAVTLPATSQHAGNVALIGAGKMGGALLEGWIGLGVDPACIVAIEPQPAAPIEALSARGVRINPDPASIRPDAIVIAVKPQIATEIMPNVASLM